MRYYWLWKTRLLQCLRGPVWEHPSVINVLTGPKHCWNLHESTFFPFYGSIWNKLSCKMSLLLRSEILGLFVITLLTHWLPVTSVLIIRGRTLWKQFKCIYLKRRFFFIIFLLSFQNLHEFWNTFKKRWASQLNYFPY